MAENSVSAMQEGKTMGDIVREIIAQSGMTHKAVAAELGLSPQNFSLRFTNNSFTAEEIKAIARITGNKLLFVAADLKSRGAVGERVQGMVDGIKFDTKKCIPICHTGKADGWFMELYCDDEGRFFVVHYSDWKNAKPLISLATKEEAQELYGRYGDGLCDELFN